MNQLRTFDDITHYCRLLKKRATGPTNSIVPLALAKNLLRHRASIVAPDRGRLVLARRQFIGGAIAAITLPFVSGIQRPVKADTPFSNLYSVLSVKDPAFGAVGNGVADDTAAIQACFDAAFGPASSPNGNTNRFSNKAVFFPSGNYKTTSALYLTNVVGGHIFGNGMNSSRISYAGSYAGNNVANADNSITPVIMTNGFAYSSITDLNIAIGNSNSCGIYSFGNFSSSPNLIQNILFEGGTVGVLAGYLSPNNVSEWLYVNCIFANCALAGLRVIGQNTLNHWVYGGGAANCGNIISDGSEAGYSCPTGSIPIISGNAPAQNKWDIYNNGSEATHISGVRTESFQFANLGTGKFVISGCTQTHASATKFAAVADTAIIDGCQSIGTAAVISGNGNLYLRGCTWANANVIAAFGGMVKQNI